MNRIRPGLLPVVVVALVTLAGCSGVAAPGSPQATTSSNVSSLTSTSTPASTTNSTHAAASAPASAGGYAHLYHKTINSVVKIRVTTPTVMVTGSGFVYDAQGDIVTNHHVIANAVSVEVQFHNGQWENATVIGSDAYSDLAVVHVSSLPANATPLHVATAPPQPGESVAAIGNPFGLTGSITTGVVSGVNRTMPTKNSFTIPGTVQTSAAINPGNSGGPLLTRNGTVIGVNRATEGVNVGFAIAPAVIRQVVPHLIQDGSYTHAYVGISTKTVTPDVAAANNLTHARGVLVARVMPNGPASGHLHEADHYVYQNGHRMLAGGDVIVAINGTQIRNGEELSRYLLLYTNPNERVPMTVLRNGTRTTVHVTLGTRPQP